MSITGKIESLAFGGEGILRHEGQVIFVPFVIPGEEIEVEITESRKNFSKGKLLQVLNPSKERIAPLCPYFGKCGGCQLQHMSYDTQLAYKKNAVKEALIRIGKIQNLPDFTIEGTPIQWEYRRQIRLKKRGEELGFIGYDNVSFVPIKRCLIYSKHNLPFQKATSPFTVEGLTFFSSPSAFVQNHPEQSALLYKDICTLVLKSQAKKVLDLYCGIGVTSILLGANGIESLGIEMNKEAIVFANKNAEYNKIDNVRFISGDAAKAPFENPDLVIVNPPRIGLSPEMIQALEKNKPAKILYISCMPSTLARDISKLPEYEIEYIKAYDMFPQTAHVETLIILARKF